MQHEIINRIHAIFSIVKLFLGIRKTIDHININAIAYTISKGIFFRTTPIITLGPLETNVRQVNKFIFAASTPGRYLGSRKAVIGSKIKYNIPQSGAKTSVFTKSAFQKNVRKARLSFVSPYCADAFGYNKVLSEVGMTIMPDIINVDSA